MPLFQLPRQFHVASNGTPYASARLYTYRANTITPLDVYTTIDYDTEHANPVEADANGIFPAIYIDPDSGYDLKIELKTSADVLIYTEDDIPRQDSDFANGDFSGNVAVAGTLAVTGATTLSGAQVTAAEPRIKLYESDAATDKKLWDIDVQGSVLSIRTRTDADAVGKDALVITRGTTTALASIAIGNATDVPAVTVNGTTLVAADVAQVSSGSFTGTLTGCSGSPTGTFNYKKNGNIVSLYADGSGVSGASTSTAMTLTGLPAAIRPPTFAPNVYTLVKDNDPGSGAYIPIIASISTGGTITFFSASTGSGTAFTAANNKGIGPGWSITYPLS